jgi:hypothetical protein
VNALLPIACKERVAPLCSLSSIYDGPWLASVLRLVASSLCFMASPGVALLQTAFKVWVGREGGGRHVGEDLNCLDRGWACSERGGMGGGKDGRFGRSQKHPFCESIVLSLPDPRLKNTFLWPAEFLIIDGLSVYTQFGCHLGNLVQPVWVSCG